MNPAVGRRWVFLIPVLGISLVIFCINLFINPWWIALWRLIQSLVVFSILAFVVVKWVAPWIMTSPTSTAAVEAVIEPADDTVGQHVDLVADDRMADDGRNEELNASPK